MLTGRELSDIEQSDPIRCQLGSTFSTLHENHVTSLKFWSFSRIHKKQPKSYKAFLKYSTYVLFFSQQPGLLETHTFFTLPNTFPSIQGGLIHWQLVALKISLSGRPIWGLKVWSPTFFLFFLKFFFFWGGKSVGIFLPIAMLRTWNWRLPIAWNKWELKKFEKRYVELSKKSKTKIIYEFGRLGSARLYNASKEICPCGPARYLWFWLLQFQVLQTSILRFSWINRRNFVASAEIGWDDSNLRYFSPYFANRSLLTEVLPSKRFSDLDQWRVWFFSID